MTFNSAFSTCVEDCVRMSHT